jgi:DNA-binding NtrC family response regulator
MERSVNILIVDDEQIVLDSVKKHLRNEDYSVHAVLSVREALVLLDQTAFDMVLTDLMMPHVDGLELMQIVKSRFPDMPVIMMTGYATISSANQATQLGAFGYVAKPFSRVELKDVIQRAVEHITKAKATTDPNSSDRPPDPDTPEG